MNYSITISKIAEEQQEQVDRVSVKPEIHNQHPKFGVMEATNGISADLNYQIEYPSNGNGNDVNIAKSDTSQRRGADCLDKENNFKNIWPMAGYESEKENKIVVVLFGWVGSEHKYLSKYSDIYLHRGCIVLRVIVPPKILFLQAEKLQSLANSVVQVFKKFELESHPIFFHTFSNGGAFVHSYLLREISAVQKQMKLDIRGTICDSGPCPRSVINGFKGVSYAFPNSPFRHLMGCLAMLVIVLHVFWTHFKSALTMVLAGEQLPLRSLDKNSIQECAKESPFKNWLGRLCKIKNYSYLFLYSDADDLFPSEMVEKIADITASHGNKVEKKKFIGSKHVQHYRKYPEEYVQVVVAFIQENMKSKKDAIVFWDDY